MQDLAFIMANWPLSTPQTCNRSRSLYYVIFLTGKRHSFFVTEVIVNLSPIQRIARIFAGSFKNRNYL